MRMKEINVLSCTMSLMQTIAVYPAADVNLTHRVRVRRAPKDAASHKTWKHAILSEYEVGTLQTDSCRRERQYLDAWSY